MWIGIPVPSSHHGLRLQVRSIPTPYSPEVKVIYGERSAYPRWNPNPPPRDFEAVLTLTLTGSDLIVQSVEPIS